MSTMVLELEVPSTVTDFRLPEGVQQRLQGLLDKQDAGTALTTNEREEAEGLVDLAEWLSLIRLQAQRIIASQHSS
jgi:hypothetical protein